VEGCSGIDVAECELAWDGVDWDGVGWAKSKGAFSFVWRPGGVATFEYSEVF
jgi:hypothetical protein